MSSAFDLVSSFFTPTYLFLFLNLIIATIYLSSRRHKPHAHDHHHLPRAPSSLIDRVRSINLSLYKFETHPEPNPSHDHYHHYPDPLREVEVAAAADGSSATPPPPPTLARAPSLLDRLRSIDFYHHKFEPAIAAEEQEQHEHHLHRAVDLPAGGVLSHSPSSLLDRLKSMNFYYQKFSNDQIDPSVEGSDSDVEPDHHHDGGNSRQPGTGYAAHGPVRRIRSESERDIGEEGQKSRMRKTASERSVAEDRREKEITTTGATTTTSGAAAGEEEINAKADDFIQRFRQQLRLQRLDSIMRYKDILTGGGGSSGR